MTKTKSLIIYRMRRFKARNDGILWLLLGVAVAAVILREILLVPGWIQYSADLTMHVQKLAELQSWTTTWNQFVGDDNSATVSMAPFFLPLLLLFKTSVVQRLQLFLAFATISGISGWVFFKWLEEIRQRRHWVVSLFGALVFTVNGWVATEAVHVLFLWMHGLLPLSFYLAWIAAGRGSVRRVALLASLGGLVATATFTAIGIAFHSLVFAATLAVTSGRVPGLRLKRWLIGLAVYVISVALFSAYWLVPIALGFKKTFAGGTSWALFTTKDTFILSGFTPLSHAIRGSYLEVTPFFTRAMLGSWGPLAMALAFGLPIAAAIGALWRWRRLPSWERGLLYLAISLAFLAKGVGVPLGKVYLLLVSAPVLRTVAFVLLKRPYLFIPPLIMLTLLLAMSSVTDRWPAHFTRKAGRLFLAVMVAIGFAVLGSILLTGDLGKYLRPVMPPQGYIDSLQKLSDVGDNVGFGSARTTWLPFDTSGTGLQPDWAPLRPPIPLIGGLMAPTPPWLSPTPVSSRSASWLAPSNGRVFDQLLVSSLRDPQSLNLSTFMIRAGRRFIAVRQDAEGGPAVAAQLQARSDFRPVVRDSWIAVFEAIPKSSPPPVMHSANLLVGGLDDLIAKSDIEKERFLEAPHILSTDINGTAGDSILQATQTITFGAGKTWEDLVLDTRYKSNRIALHNLVGNTFPLSGWDKDFFESHLWIPQRLSQIPLQSFDPSRQPFLVATQPASLSVPSRLLGGPGEVWLRVFRSPRGGVITVDQGRRRIGEASGYSASGGYWKWLRVGSIEDASRDLRLKSASTLTALDSLVVIAEGKIGNEVANLARVPQVETLGRWGNLVAADESYGPRAFDSAEATSGIVRSGAGVDYSLPIDLSGIAHRTSGYWAVTMRSPMVNLTDVLALRVTLRRQMANDADMILRLIDERGNQAEFRLSAETARNDYTYYLPLASARLLNKAFRPIQSSFDYRNISVFQFAIATKASGEVNLRLVDISLVKRGIHQVFAPRRGSYRIALHRRPDQGIASPQMKVGGVSLTLGEPREGWAVSPPFELEAGPNPVETSAQVEDSDWLVLREVSNERRLPKRFAFSASKVPFNDGWRREGGSLPVRTDGFVAGFVMRERPGRLFFKPDQFLAPGRVLSLTAVGVLLCWTWLGRRRRLSDGSIPHD